MLADHPTVCFSRLRLLLIFGYALTLLLDQSSGVASEINVAANDKAAVRRVRGPDLVETSVFVHLIPGADRGTIRRLARGMNGRVKYEYAVMPNLINVRGLPPQAVNALSRLPGVVRVEPDEVVYADMDDSMPSIRGLRSQLSSAGYSSTGAGVRICIIDTGLDSDHALFADRIDHAAGWDFVNDDGDPEDDNKHGTHVAGIAAGGLWNPLDVNSCTYLGMPSCTSFRTTGAKHGTSWWMALNSQFI